MPSAWLGPQTNQCRQTRPFTGPWESCDSIRQEHALAAARREHPKPATPADAKRLSASAPSRYPSVSAGHVKKPDLLGMRPVEHLDRLGGGLQYYLAALLREISLSLRR